VSDITTIHRSKGMSSFLRRFAFFIAPLAAIGIPAGDWAEAATPPNGFRAGET